MKKLYLLLPLLTSLAVSAGNPRGKVTISADGILQFENIRK